MTDNTQELDKMVAIFQDHAASNGYPMNDEHKRGAEIHKQAVLDWHNKQMSELLDRLESKASYDPSARSPLINPLEIQAERIKVKEEYDGKREGEGSPSRAG